jgi:hypothetical protein
MNAEQLRSYLLYLLEERKLSWSAIHVVRLARLGITGGKVELVP